MIIACPACRTRYVVPDKAIGVDGRTVRCAKCKHSWFQDGPALAEAPVRPEAPPPASPPVPPVPPPVENSEEEETPPPAPPVADRHEAEPEDATSAAVEEEKFEEPVPPAPEPVSEPDSDPEPEVEESAETGEAEAEAEAADASTQPSINHWRIEKPPVPPKREASRAKPEPEAVEETEDDEPAEPPAYAAPMGDFASDEPDAESFVESYDDASQFDYEPPFRPRRNPLKLWTAAAIMFAVLAFGTMISVSYWGLPDWVPVSRPTFAVNQPQLQLDFPPDQQDRRTLPNGTEYFGASGTVTNVGRETVSVPPILIVLRDEFDRIVYTWEILPPQSNLAPGETITVREAVTDVPRSAKFAEIGWKPS